MNHRGRIGLIIGYGAHNRQRQEYDLKLYLRLLFITSNIPWQVF
jgi:hypothetical protein